MDEVELAQFETGEERLVLVVDVAEVIEDPICHYIFHTARPGRGHLALVNPELPELVTDAIAGAASAAQWLRQGNAVSLVVVTCDRALRSA
jgi:hypothetical protein